MKRLVVIFPMLLLLCVLWVGCKNGNTSTTQKEESSNKVGHLDSLDTFKKSINKVGGDSVKLDSNFSSSLETNIVEPDSNSEALLKETVDSKSTNKPVEKVNRPVTKPVKKPKPKKVRSAPKKYLPKMEFDESVHDFGEIVEGDIIKHNFTFTNTGKTNLSIKKATATCGCTKPSFPFLDIEPGETGYIGVVYNSVNKEGEQKPEITVYSNGIQKEITLYLKGKVNPKKEPIGKSDSIDTLVQDSIKH